MNTTENNKIIARFNDYPEYKIQFHGKHLNFENSRHNTYHKDWNMLMPVVEKIESLVFKDDEFYNFNIGGGCQVYVISSFGDVLLDESEPTKLLTVYKAVVEFIKWYNENKK